MREDFLSVGINRLADGIGLGPVLVGALAVLLVGLILVCSRRTHKAGMVVSSVGVIALWLGLVAVQLAEVKTQVSPFIAIVQPKYTLLSRITALYGTALIPVFVAVAGVALWRVGVQRRRAMLPIHLKNGLKAFFQQDFETALKEYGTAISIDRDRAETYNRRGLVYLQMGNLDQAIADFDRAVEIEPELAAGYRHRGLVFAARDNLEQALNDFDFALKIDGTDCASMVQRGLCYSRLGQSEKAVTELQRVLQLTNHSDYADPARDELRRLGALE